ncbi:MAG TPA: plastocyanin/azurin family copper-binding protein [Candidatus Krumholzibacteria bacterium]
MQINRTLFAACLAASLAIVASCGDDDSSNPPDGSGTFNGTIRVVDNAFSPSDVSITVGDSVTWRWEGNNTHTVTEGTSPTVPPDAEKLFDSPSKTSGTFGYRFTTAETVNYFCRIHSGMKGIVRVKP